ncbi:LL-diaminopimelate aminotransferase [Dialister succinatiphilus]|jgi:LL-diaminopimelate aminotransferase|uniref:LL-diaminopimelate aminotransferase n=1 Tax=Dialister succinatiphilus TaxID=487173 RepID=UPI002354702A|nr:LL-diaminopimelate aminotransferase [Dialister succinatiphilus]
MAHCNENYLNLQGAYLFATVRQKQNAYVEAHPNADIISLGIGDVTQPLAPAVIEAMHKAVDEMAHMETFRGYGPEQGYLFLREAIAKHDFKDRGCDISPDEIFVSDGAKCDTGNMQEIFAESDVVAVTDPVYPVYVDSNVMAGRSGKFVNGSYERLEYLPCYEECGFKANLPSHDPMIIYLCSPNNPTGAALNKKDLTMWVKYAKQTGSVIFFDAAYEAFITEDDIPHSIYEIEGAKEVAIEFRSYSKTAGFTGVRCGYCVVPKELMLETKSGEMVSANALWDRRQCTKFNGCSYIVQRGAEAIYTEEGQKEIQATLDIYRNNARVILEGVKEAGLTACGGVNSPYVWLSVPKGMTSWEFFDYLLNEAQIICTPGSGFGPCGEGYVRLTSFNTPELTKEAVERLKKAVKKLEK